MSEISFRFQHKIAKLIVAGRFQRAAREVARYNSGKSQGRVHLFLDRYEQLKWAEKLLGVQPPSGVQQLLEKVSKTGIVPSPQEIDNAMAVQASGMASLAPEPRKKLTVKLTQRNENTQ